MNGSTSTPTVYIVLDTWWDEKPIRATAPVSVHCTEQAAEEAVAYCYIAEAEQMAEEEDEGQSSRYVWLDEVVGDADHCFHMDSAPLES